ncbi:MAG: hypothetical protein ABF979_13140 [Gluconobacter sp.]|uniref:hypothetical protein n=1 Tax=Gluconobacter sp. TaxID=1876758 RepID=UPI0039E8CA1D
MQVIVLKAGVVIGHLLQPGLQDRGQRWGLVRSTKLGPVLNQPCNLRQVGVIGFKCRVGFELGAQILQFPGQTTLVSRNLFLLLVEITQQGRNRG